VPIVKKATDRNRSWRRPKSSDKATMKGWKMALVRRKDVPTQKVSVVLP
jgi:hypothetical protein